MEEHELRRKIYDELSKVVDPEIMVSIMDLDLVDDIKINNSCIEVGMHLTSPFCPPAFGFKIAFDAHNNLIKIDEIKDVKINLTGHYMAEAISNAVNSSQPPNGLDHI